MDAFIQISLVLIISTCVAGLMKKLNQPAIVGYILTGLLMGPAFLNVLSTNGIVEILSQMGIAMLLFIVGLNLSPSIVKDVGKFAVITGIGQIIFTTITGYLLSLLLGFTAVESAYISIALTFSSTIIILKLLSDKKELNDLHGKISIGFLLLQDVIASLALVGVSALSADESIGVALTNILVKGVFLISIVAIFGIYVLPSLIKFFAKSQEHLFIFSISYGFGLATIFSILGFSVEIGALVAGITLSMFSYNHEIASKMKPLRDFFIIIFFILLGSELSLGDMERVLVPALFLSLFVLIGKPLIVILLMGKLGFKKRVSFLSGLSVAQISEFSLILIALGMRVGHINSSISTLVTLVALITIAGSSYMITYSRYLFNLFSKYLSLFEFNVRPYKQDAVNYDVVLFGYDRIGYDFLRAFKKAKMNSLIVDYNPETIKRLEKKGINCMYGDAGDVELLDDLNLESSKLFVSTIPSLETNLLIVKRAKKANDKIIAIVLSHDIYEAELLYKAGASYVVIPHILGGEYASSLITKHKFDHLKFSEEKELHMEYIRNRRNI